MTPLERKESLIKKYRRQKNMSKCKSCIHDAVCCHIQEFAELEGKLPITGATPFTAVLICAAYYQQPSTGYPQHTGGAGCYGDMASTPPPDYRTKITSF